MTAAVIAIAVTKATAMLPDHESGKDTVEKIILENMGRASTDGEILVTMNLTVLPHPHMIVEGKSTRGGNLRERKVK